MEYQEFVKGKKVTKIKFKNDDSLIISFDLEPKQKLCLYANADCCSESWFEKLKHPFDSFIGKEITKIFFDNKKL